MKRLLFALLLLAAAATAAVGADSVTVIVKKTSIRRDRSFASPTLAEAAYHDRLSVLETDRDWIRVRSGGVEGWIHVSAVSNKAGTPGRKFSLFGKKDDPAKVSEDEVALAGKGFNEQVEEEYRKKNPDLDFAEVDRLERASVSESDVARFLETGHLAGREAPQ